MTNLSEDELLEEVRRWYRFIKKWYQGAHTIGATQAYNQIVALIKKPEVTEEWIIEQAENTASDYPDVAFPNLITIFKGLLKEAGVSIAVDNHHNKQANMAR